MGGDGETQVVLELQTRVSLRQAGMGLGIGFVTEGELRIKSLGVCSELWVDLMELRREQKWT